MGREAGPALSSSGQVAGRGVLGKPHFPQRSSPALLPRREGRGALAGAQPWGPEATSLAVPSRAGPSESKNETAQTNRSSSAGPAGSPRGSGSPLGSTDQLARSAGTCTVGDRHQGPGGSDTEGASVLLGRCECVLRTRQRSGREEGDWAPTNSGSVTASRACQSLSGPGGRPPRRTGRIVLIRASLYRRL